VDRQRGAVLPAVALACTLTTRSLQRIVGTRLRTFVRQRVA
jgi:hypothetical protein